MTPPAGYATLLFWDDFYSLDTAIWTPSNGTASDGLGTFRSANVSAANSLLTLRVDSNYDSVHIRSFLAFNMHYGYTEAKIRIRQIGINEGLWWAFWLWSYSSVSSGPHEVDFEIRQGIAHSAEVYCNVIRQILPEKLQDASLVATSITDGAWHVLGFEWSPTVMVWYIDGTEVKRVTTNLQHAPMDLLFDAKVGGTFAGAPDETTTYPAYMDVDYVGVWVNRPINAYFRVQYTPGSLDAAHQTYLENGLKQLGDTFGMIGANRKTVIRKYGTSDYVVEGFFYKVLTVAELANALYVWLGVTEAVAAENLVITAYDTSSWAASLAALKAALTLA